MIFLSNLPATYPLFPEIPAGISDPGLSGITISRILFAGVFLFLAFVVSKVISGQSLFAGRIFWLSAIGVEMLIEGILAISPFFVLVTFVIGMLGFCFIGSIQPDKIPSAV